MAAVADDLIQTVERINSTMSDVMLWEGVTGTAASRRPYMTLIQSNCA